MSVTKTLRALGNWNLSLSERMPAEKWDALDYFGHIAIHSGRIDPRVDGDALLRSARYVGVLRSKSESGLPKKIGGLDVAMWLGDPDNKSDIIEELLEVTGDLETVVEAVMAGFDAVQIGTIFNVVGTFTQSFQFQTRRQVIDYIAQTFPGTNAWRVNGDATLDIGPESSIFQVNPKVAVVRKPKAIQSIGGSEVDMFLRSLNGTMETQQDVEDLTTRVLLMAQGTNGQFASATADAPPGTHPFLDMHGNPIKLTRIVQESETNPDNADARAQLALNRFLGTRDALTLTTEFYDVQGSAEVGDYIWVWDPMMSLEDPDNEVVFRGQRMNPLKLQMTEVTWPISRGMSVAYRDWLGNWTDLTDYVEWETGDTTLVVGGYNRALNESGSGSFPITQPEQDLTTPDVTEWDLPWSQSMYQSPINGESKSEVELKWIRPNNTNGSLITDGDYYEIRYRQSVTPYYDLTLDELDELELDDWVSVENPILLGIEQEWGYVRAPFEVLKFRLQELTPGMTYEAQIRAVDNARPANVGDWSDLIQWQASRDIFPPATPAAPFVASSPMGVLFTHNLGRAEGGEFNLDRDLHHLVFHGAEDPLFSPTKDNVIGIALANWGMITGEVPIVASFQITSIAPLYYKVVAVDESGNASLPSAAVVSTADLIDNQFVRNLVVDKVTAGTISADWIVGGYIRTGKTGARVEMNYTGIHGFGADNIEKLNWDSASGQLRVIGKGGISVTGGGNVEITDGAVIVYNAAGKKIVEMGECADGRHGVQVYRDTGVRVTRIGELASGSEGIEIIDDLGRLVRVDTLAFGQVGANLPGAVATTLATFNGNTPQATGVVIGNSGRALVYINCWIAAGAGGAGGQASFGISGATTRAAQAAESISNGIPSSTMGFGGIFLVEGLNAGTHTFYMTYKATTAGTTQTYVNRSIAVQPF